MAANPAFPGSKERPVAPVGSAVQEYETAADPADFQQLAVGQPLGKKGRGLKVIVGAQAVDPLLPSAPAVQLRPVGATGS